MVDLFVSFYFLFSFFPVLKYDLKTHVKFFFFPFFKILKQTCFVLTYFWDKFYWFTVVETVAVPPLP